MATIHTALAMQDAMSPVLDSLILSMERTLNVMDRLDKSSTEMMTNVNVTMIDSMNKSFANTGQAAQKVNITQQAVSGLGEAAQKTSTHVRQMNTNMSLLNTSAFIDIAKNVWNATKGAISYIDSLTSIQSRLKSVATANESVEDLQKRIKLAANDSRASYDAMANSVYQLRNLAGDAFTSNDEAIDFLTKLNKQFVVAGTESTSAKAAMYQLNQALASGRLQGDEFRSVAENAPMLAQAIADVMGVSKAELKSLSSQGAITADIIKQAVQQSAAEVDAKLKEMPMTFSDAVTRIKNDASIAFTNVSNKFSNMINSEKVAKISSVISNGIYVGASIASVAVDLLSGSIGFLSDSMGVLLPVVIGLTSAFIAYKAASLLSAGITAFNGTVALIAAFKEKVWAASVWLASDATFAQTAAQWGLNAALLACPLTWVVLAILALIVLLYMGVGALNALAGTSISATGVLCGAFMVALAFIGNLFVGLWNFVAEVIASFYNGFVMIANFIANVFVDPVGSIVRLFADMADSILGVIQGIAEALDAVFGSSLAESVRGWRDGLTGLVKDHFGEEQELIEKLNSQDLKLNRFEYGEAWSSGYQFGEGIDNSIGGMFNMDSLTGQMSDLQNALNPDSYGAEEANVGNVGSVDSVGSIEGEVSLSDEDIKMLKDVASRKYINQFTTLKPNMTVTFGDVHETADTDAIMDAIATMTEQALAETILEEAQ